jgi:hypothetical protein
VSPAPDERPLLPIACTLGPQDGAARLEEWRQITASVGLGRTNTPGQLTLRFRDDSGVGDELRRLVDAERACCAFLGWEVTHVDTEWRVEITGTDEELQALPFSL